MMVLTDHRTKSGAASQAISWRRSVLVLGMCRFLQQVAQPADGAYGDPRWLQLAPQAMNVDLDGVGAHFLVPPVELLGELILVDDASASQHQHFEDADLARGELERLAVQRSAPARGVERERAVSEQRAPARLTAPDEGPHARFQLRQVERLGEVVVGAQVESLDPVLERIERGEYQYRRPRAAAPQSPQDFIAVEAGQSEVEDYQVVGIRGEDVIGLSTVSRTVHGVIGGPQR